MTGVLEEVAARGKKGHKIIRSFSVSFFIFALCVFECTHSRVVRNCVPDSASARPCLCVNVPACMCLRAKLRPQMMDDERNLHLWSDSL